MSLNNPTHNFDHLPMHDSTHRGPGGDPDLIEEEEPTEPELEPQLNYRVTSIEVDFHVDLPVVVWFFRSRPTGEGWRPDWNPHMRIIASKRWDRFASSVLKPLIDSHRLIKTSSELTCTFGWSVTWKISPPPHSLTH